MISFENCTGCSACFNICPKNAITMEPNVKGFIVPSVNFDKCVNCKLCDSVCLNKIDLSGNQPKKVYAAFSKDDIVRINSASGGYFATIADYILNKGGVVFGASMQFDLTVKHICITDTSDIEKIRKSKYLQSEIGDTFTQIKKYLEDNKTVLFSGTPCQVAGLNLFLGKDYSNLITVDILCHGVPSKTAFDKYMASEENKAGSKLTDFKFRSKKLGWKNYISIRTFKNGSIADWPDTFVPGYLSNYYLNDSCYSCKFANNFRQGDISLGDYWGYKESAPDYIEDDNKGINLVLLNTAKGQKLFNKTKHIFISTERPLSDAVKGNPILEHPSVKPERYSEFWSDFDVLTWDELQEKYFWKQEVKDILSQEKKDYFNQPTVKRQFNHWLKYTKKDIKKSLIKHL